MRIWLFRNNPFLIFGYLLNNQISVWSNCWIPRHSVPPLFSLVGVLWRTKHNTIDAILIQWHANKWQGILQLSQNYLFLFVGVVDFAYGRNKGALREYRTLHFSVFAVFTLFSCSWTSTDQSPKYGELRQTIVILEKERDLGKEREFKKYF